ncbi:MAG: hypothetical protein IRY91_06060 [Gemmatimonadaceae bacterium]|nr:hypothetical protein [Gemmatimonadaceae bacterium]
MVAAAGLVLALGAPRASAQTRFAWPDTAVHIAQYATADECVAAAHRVMRILAQREALTVWRDTLPRDPRLFLEPLPAPVVETARRCAARYVEPTAPLDEFAPLLQLYLLAGRDSDAAALVARRTAAVPAKSTRERTAVGDTALAIYLAARPVRLEQAEQLLLGRARATTDRVKRLELYSQLMKAADAAGDTARARRAAQWLLAVADSLTTAERESEAFDKLAHGLGGRMVVFDAMQLMLGQRMLLDSLRSGTGALRALMRNTWAQVTGERPEAMPFPIGEHAPAVTADYWIPREASGTPHPAPGRVSIVMFLDHHGCLHSSLWGETSDQCPPVLTALRRLSDRFPEVQVTIVTQTHGSFVYAPPPSPTEEVELIRKWLEPYAIHGLEIAVSATPFWNLPQPDGRRIDKRTPNQISYSFGKSWRPEGAFLVDQDGLIVSAVGLNESLIASYIEVLLQRQTAGGHRAAQ